MKVNVIKAIRFSAPVVMMFFFLFELQRNFTNFPRVVIYIQAGSIQDKLDRATDISTYLGSWSTFAYFTTLSNLLCVCTIFLSWTLGIKMSKYWNTAVLIYMIITGIVFWTMIAPWMPWGQSHYLDFINTHEHLLVLVYAVVYWYFSGKSGEKVTRSFIVSIIFPIIYLLFSIIIYAVTGKGIYPFLDYLDFFSLGLNKGVSIILSFLTILGIVIVVYLLSYTLVKYQSIWSSSKKLKKYF